MVWFLLTVACMYLSRKMNNGIEYLYLMESVHVPGKRYCQKKIIKSYGRWDKLDESTRKQYLEPKAKKELEKRLEQERRLSELKTAGSVVDTQQQQEASASEQTNDDLNASANFNKAQALEYGHVALKEIWDKELGLTRKIDNLQMYHREFRSWSLNDALFYLCASRLISPRSYLSSSNLKSGYLYCPWQNVTQDNFYRALDFVYEFRDKLIRHAVKTHLQNQGEKVKVAFFDCTNTYFETPYDDVTWQIIRFTRKVRELKRKEGLSERQIDEYLQSEEFAESLKKELESRKDEVLRMRGPSKEGRFNQPIVTVALAINQSGFPIDCEVKTGNTSELKTVEPLLDSLKSKYQIDDVYFVADRGLNSTEILNTLQGRKLGFVVARKVSKQKAAERKEMLDLRGYQRCALSAEGDFIKTESHESADDHCYRLKVCPHTRSAYVPDTDKNATTARRKITVSCKIVYTFSPKRKDRDIAELESEIAKAKNAVSEGRLMGNPYTSGWRSLVKTRKEAAKNKTEKEQYKAVGLKEEVIENRRQTAGYAAVVYDDPNLPDGTRLDCYEVLRLYHRLVDIEDCFRIMKSTFSIRPVYLRVDERITAHCYLCVLSLMLLRCVQNALEKANHPMSAERISRALRNALLVPLPYKEGQAPSFLNVGLELQGHAARKLKTGHGQSGIEDTLDQNAVWEMYLQEREEEPDDLDKILTALRLKPLKLINTLGEIKSSLNLRFCSDENMIAYEQRKLIEKTYTAL